MSGLPKRILGATDLLCSLVGLGTVKFGRNTDVKYPNGFEIPDDQAAMNLLALAKDLGINLIDTAPAYGNSEERLGKLLRDQRRDWIISTKAGEDYINNESTYEYGNKSLIASIDRSLRRLKTDYIDMLLIHSNGDDKNIIERYDVFGTLSKAKQAGKIRYYGMSSKTVEGGILTIKHADIAMVEYNLNNDSQQEVLDFAKVQNKGILIKKAFASGYLAVENNEQHIHMALEHVYRQPSVSSIILGTINPSHLRDNVAGAIAASK